MFLKLRLRHANLLPTHGRFPREFKSCNDITRVASPDIEVLFRLAHSIKAIFSDVFRSLWFKEEEGGKYPHIGIPKGVSEIEVV